MHHHAEPQVVQAYAVVEEALSGQAESVDETGLRNFLQASTWPTGLQECLIKGARKIPIRFFICDDSGSMAYTDGKQIVKSDNGGNEMMVPCSRWSELVQSLRFHAELAHCGSVPTEFRMLNRGTPVQIGFGQDCKLAQTPLETFCQQLEDSPFGGTPLCRHIRDIIRQIESRADALRQAGQLACLVIATDGHATDGNLADAMRPLKNLPVWIVVRLCTNDDSVVKYWSEIDSELELSMDVLDDFQGEAQEVYKYNPWLTYGEPLHRMREFGVHVKEIDFLDEKKCELEQIRVLSHIIFGGNLNDYPHPQVDYAGFQHTINNLNALTDRVYCPDGIGGRQRWVNLPARWVQRGPRAPQSSLCVVS